MKTNRKTAVFVGILFLLAMASSLIGGSLIEPILNNPDGLFTLSANQAQLVAGVMLELVNAVAVVGIAVFMFPILKQNTEALALGYIGIRIIEAVIQIIGDMIPLSLLNVSQEYVVAGVLEAANVQAASVLWIAARTQLVGTMLGLFFSLGALLFYYALVQSRVLPRWLSIWGLIGAVLILTWNLLNTFGIQLSAGIILALPMILNEIFLGIWLIVKGFEPSAKAYVSAKRLHTEAT